ncbi:hypothetical protein [Beijerinckia sp. L45]|uniref:hypothetical protein n=1 Tax=Beijerinckia sp. L45 TaxID=1641855 RepID=UPI00131E0DC1|nr:hypothetical protein [Beijerinckia sp. L45]
MVKSDKAAASPHWIVSNEFATVRLSIDTSGNDPRLRIEDLSTDLSVALDAFMLAGLTTATETQLSEYMDPNTGTVGEDTPR